MEIEKILKDITAISEYKPDWDGYGGLVPDARCFAAAKQLIYALKDESLVPPSVTMSSYIVELYWHDGHETDLYVEFQISKENPDALEINWYLVNNNTPIEAGEHCLVSELIEEIGEYPLKAKFAL